MALRDLKAAFNHHFLFYAKCSDRKAVSLFWRNFLLGVNRDNKFIFMTILSTYLQL